MLPAGDESTTGTSCDPAREAGLTSILVVDDDSTYCEAVARSLAPTPLRPIAVDSRAGAMRCLARTRPAFIVLDFNLPDAKAPAVLAELRADPAWRDIPVLVMTSLAGAADERAVLAAGAQAYHEKPSRVAALRALIVDFWRTYGGPHGDPDRR